MTRDTTFQAFLYLKEAEEYHEDTAITRRKRTKLVQEEQKQIETA